MVAGAHFWWGQFEHSITLRPLPRVQLLARTSASLTLLPHWQVLVFGAGGCSWGCCWAWASGSSRCLLWPMVGDGGVCVVIVVAFLCVWLSLSHTITPTNHFNFPISQWSQKNRSYPAFISLTFSLLPFRSSFFLLFLAIPAALVAVPVSFAVGGVFHTVRKPAQAAAQCSVTECQFRV